MLPTMREQKWGHVINLSSVAGHVVFPGAAVYCATKFAVRALSEGLRMESNGKIWATNISLAPWRRNLPEASAIAIQPRASTSFIQSPSPLT